LSAHAIAARRMQFVAGPQSHVFHACATHQGDLLRPWYANDLFFAVPRWPVEAVNPDDEIGCDSCRGEDGP
jgi:hypothetical protein